jgi:MerR family redox-sensitive transcriptional activator SoxR
VGLSLEEISEALSTLPGGRTPTAADWSRLSASWRGRINSQIERLERLRDRLDSCIGCGCLSLNRCSLSNPDDELRSRGPGAVYLEPAGATSLEPSEPRRQLMGARPEPSAG